MARHMSLSKTLAATVPTNLSLNSILLQPLRYGHPTTLYNTCQSHPLYNLYIMENFFLKSVLIYYYIPSPNLAHHHRLVPIPLCKPGILLYTCTFTSNITVSWGPTMDQLAITKYTSVNCACTYHVLTPEIRTPRYKGQKGPSQWSPL